MMILFRTLLFAVAVLLPAAAEKQAVLTMEMYYGDTKIADVRDQLQIGADHYEINSTAAAVGLAKILHGDSSFFSSGEVDSTHGLLMTVYQGNRGRRDPQQAVRMGDQLQLQRGEETRTEQLSEPLFDYLSAIYRSYALGTVAIGKLKFTNGWRLRDYDYVIEGEETVMTGMGEIATVVIRRDSERGARRIWLAPSLDYLPVRLYVDEKGHEFTMIVQSVEK